MPDLDYCSVKQNEYSQNTDKVSLRVAPCQRHNSDLSLRPSRLRNGGGGGGGGGGGLHVG